jgi:hypothetical protein
MAHGKAALPAFASTEDDVAEWLRAFQTIKEAHSDEQDERWYECADRIYTPDQKPLEMTPSTPERDEQPPGIIFPVFQLPPPSQPIPPPVFAFGKNQKTTATSQRRKIGKARRLFRDKIDTTQATVTVAAADEKAEAGTQTMKPAQRDYWTQVIQEKCGCLRCTREVNTKCKWTHVVRIAAQCHRTAQQQLWIVLVQFAARIHTKQLSNELKAPKRVATQTPSRMGRPKGRTVSSQAGYWVEQHLKAGRTTAASQTVTTDTVETAIQVEHKAEPTVSTVETQTMVTEPAASTVESDIMATLFELEKAVQTSPKGDDLTQKSDTDKKDFSKTSALPNEKRDTTQLQATDQIQTERREKLDTKVGPENTVTTPPQGDVRTSVDNTRGNDFSKTSALPEWHLAILAQKESPLEAKQRLLIENMMLGLKLSCGLELTHTETRALRMKEAVKEAGKEKRARKETDDIIEVMGGRPTDP